MALTIEDGSVVTGADSYITATEYQTWADARFGSARSTAPADDAAAEVLIRRAMDYFETLPFFGFKSEEAQPLQWPRYDVWIDGYPVDGDEIPADVKRALYELTYAEEQSDGMFDEIKRKTRREKIGEIEVEYSDNSASRKIRPSVSASLRKLIRSQSMVYRV